VPVLNPGRAGAPPFDRLPPALQQTRHWAFEKVVRELGWLPNTIAAAESWRGVRRAPAPAVGTAASIRHSSASGHRARQKHE
jgi:hypothetical protein